MRRTNSEQKSGTNELPKVLESSLSSGDTVSGGNEIHPTVVLTVLLHTLRGGGEKRWDQRWKLLLPFRFKGSKCLVTPWPQQSGPQLGASQS